MKSVSYLFGFDYFHVVPIPQDVLEFDELCSLAV